MGLLKKAKTIPLGLSWRAQPCCFQSFKDRYHFLAPKRKKKQVIVPRLKNFRWVSCKTLKTSSRNVFFKLICSRRLEGHSTIPSTPKGAAKASIWQKTELPGDTGWIERKDLSFFNEVWFWHGIFFQFLRRRLGFRQNLRSNKTFLLWRRAKGRQTKAKVTDEMVDLAAQTFMKELRGVRFNLSSCQQNFLPKTSYETFRNQLRLLRDWQEGGS